MSKLRTNSIILLILGIVTMILGVLLLEGKVDIRITITSLSLCTVLIGINSIFVLYNYKKNKNYK